MTDLKFLIDQDVSPTHVARLNDLGCCAEHVAHMGMSGTPDHAIVSYAFEKSLVIVTKNTEDFVRLANNTPLHPGMILLRDGHLRVLEEWQWLEPVVRHLQATALDPVNMVIDVTGAGVFQLLNVPPP